MINLNEYNTEFLLNKYNFLTGAGSVLNLAGNYYDYEVSDNAALEDALALAYDWSMVWNDMNSAINQFEVLIQSDGE
jgi:hypothetical protein